MKTKKKICSFCSKALPKKPFKVILYSDDGIEIDDYTSFACDECAKILNYMVRLIDNEMKENKL